MRELPVLDRYSPQNLMSDGSVQFEGFDPKLLYELAEREPLLTALQHPEVRYETTDYCNAACIMCPRDLHQEGREHGVMDLEKYKRSIDEVVPLGAKRVVLTGFGEPLMDRTLDEKVAYTKSKGLHTYIITNASLLSKQSWPAPRQRWKKQRRLPKPMKRRRKSTSRR